MNELTYWSVSRPTRSQGGNQAKKPLTEAAGEGCHSGSGRCIATEDSSGLGNDSLLPEWLPCWNVYKKPTSSDINGGLLTDFKLELDHTLDAKKTQSC